MLIIVSIDSPDWHMVESDVSLLQVSLNLSGLEIHNKNTWLNIQSLHINNTAWWKFHLTDFLPLHFRSTRHRKCER